MSVDLLPALRPARVAWNKGRIIGQKRSLLPRPVWSIRVRLARGGGVKPPELRLEPRFGRSTAIFVHRVAGRPGSARC